MTEHFSRSTVSAATCKGSYLLGSACGKCDRCGEELMKSSAQVREAWRLLEAASHTLRSYQFGNAAADPAKDMADAIDRFRATGEPQTLIGKKEKIR